MFLVLKHGSINNVCIKFESNRLNRLQTMKYFVQNKMADNNGDWDVLYMIIWFLLNSGTIPESIQKEFGESKYFNLLLYFDWY